MGSSDVEMDAVAMPVPGLQQEHGRAERGYDAAIGAAMPTMPTGATTPTIAANTPNPDLPTGAVAATPVASGARMANVNTATQIPGPGAAMGAGTATMGISADAAIRDLDSKLAKLTCLIEKQNEEIERLKTDRDEYKSKVELGGYKGKAILLDEGYFRRLSKFAGDKSK